MTSTQTEPGLSTPEVRVDVVAAGLCVAVVTGEIDLDSVGQFRAALAAATGSAERDGLMVVDLTEVGHLGAAGVSELLVLARHCTGRGTTLRLVASRHPVTDVLLVAGFEHWQDVETACTEWRSDADGVDAAAGTDGAAGKGWHDGV